MIPRLNVVRPVCQSGCMNHLSQPNEGLLYEELTLPLDGPAVSTWYWYCSICGDMAPASPWGVAA